MYWIFLIPTLFLVLLAVAAIGIKSIVKKNGRFERKCAHSLDPDAKCVCGGDGECPNKNVISTEAKRSGEIL
ncbi:MAG: hypothetical protein J6W12_05690 [Bacteroidales bacterium]|nr:hypothetical protein [Bacteroidales bacterium]